MLGVLDLWSGRHLNRSCPRASWATWHQENGCAWGWKGTGPRALPWESKWLSQLSWTSRVTDAGSGLSSGSVLRVIGQEAVFNSTPWGAETQQPSRRLCPLGCVAALTTTPSALSVSQGVLDNSGGTRNHQRKIVDFLLIRRVGTDLTGTCTARHRDHYTVQTQQMKEQNWNKTFHVLSITLWSSLGKELLNQKGIK